ncbi:MAG: hypothetical protein ACRDWN_04545, partial [Acidimicrobiales bacterium]
MAATALAEAGTTQPVRWFRRPDVVAVAVLVAVPLVVFAVPPLFGAPAIAGDNLIQNFPLRALSGAVLRQGHLPLWNPYIWSGSPLLGGLNAGSFYPLTFLFAVVAPVGAWVANMVGTYMAAGLGIYALGRQYRLRPLACLLGGLVYAFGGAMSGQMVHLGVIQGMGWVPFLVLAQLRLAWAVLGRNGARASPWRWVALLAAVIGLEALTGEPRAMAETEMVAAAVGCWLVLRPYGVPIGLRRRLAYVALSALAAAWGVALAAAELAPGWSFIRGSQRAVESYWFFASGSLPLKWSALLFVPDLFGGNGVFGQPAYFNRYNLPEVTGYVGLLALGAALVLLTRSFGRRRDTGSTDWGLWLALLVLGLLLAWGNYTPLGHLWYQVPLFGKTRLQSRNLGIVDLALSMVLVFWADRALAGRLVDAGLAGWRRGVMVAPAAVSIGLAAAVLAAPVAVEGWFGIGAAGGALAHHLVPWMAAQIAVAGAAIALVLGWRRLPWRRVLLGSLVVVDILTFSVATVTGLNAGHEPVEPTRARAAAVLGSSGRFAIVDVNGVDPVVTSAVGQPDLNAFTHLPSVQGYGSILSDTYGTATGTHALDSMTACALARGAFAPLRLSTILVSPGGLGPGAPTTGAPAPPASCPGASAPGTRGHRVLYLGFPLLVSSARLVTSGPARPAGSLQVAVVGAHGGERTVPVTVRPDRTGWSVQFAHPVLAYGLALSGPARAVSVTSTVTGRQPPGPSPPPSTVQSQWTFDGAFQGALGAAGWHFEGVWRTFAVFTRAARPPVWLAGGPAGSHVTRVRTTEWGTEVDRVSASRPVTVVRSEAYLAGWRAEAVPVGGGPAHDVAVTARGLVQQVHLPAGQWDLTFHYRAPHLTLGLAGSAAA